MYRGLLHAAAWTLTTAVAVALSWFGVHSVLRSTAYDLPRALPISTTSGILVPATSKPPAASAAPTPRRSAPPPPHPRPSATVTRTLTPIPAAPPKTPPGTPHPAPSATATAGDVHSYTLQGGRVVLTLTATEASLVTATPAADWKMQVWTQPGWLRVTFTSADGAQASSLFCTWNGHPPQVQTYDD
ncbi:hypothetical protein GTW78_25870 [Streptomyces sp. SID4948]|nr:hypothetical protein [Streptomyces sp. DvalAA-14]MYS23490.1 hypothetical protein [Streptomyces sp. SID4948]